MRLLLTSLAAGVFLACCAASAPAEQGEFERRVKNNSDGDGWAGGEAHPWRQMQTGPFFSASIDTGEEPVAKGIVIRLGDNGRASVCFDTELLRMARGWTGGFLEFTARRYGLAAMPRVIGEIQFATPPLPGWSRDKNFPDPRPHKPLGPLPRSHAHYRGLYRHEGRVVLSYSVGQTDVLESPWIEEADGLTAFTRTLQLGPTERTQHLLLLEAQGKLQRGGAGESRFMWSEHKGQAAAVAVVGLKGEAALKGNAGGQFLLTLPASDATRRFKILLWSGPRAKLSAFRALVAGSPPPEDLKPLTRPGPAQWTAEIVTEGQLAASDAPYVVDTLTLPFENPYGALFFVSGLDFFANGDAAICTAHGDVWRVSGIDADLDRLVWKRMATGLAQPLGVKIVNEQVYVVGRDQITRLHDKNRDGEADFYENFNNDAEVTTNPHEYVTCLETDSAGNFYFLKGNSGGKSAHDGCLLRVSADGERLEIFATGFRNANGMSIGPDGTITVAPQEGHWTPSSAIFAVEQGGFYGMMDVHHRSTVPKTFDPPLCWIPHAIDSSSGGQIWITGDRWGPLDGQMLHLSYGRCAMLLVVREKREGQDQAGVVELPLHFASGVTRGCFRPQDGQLYVCGQRGWGTSAAQDGCFQRVRYTGRPVDLPVGMRTLQNGLALTFSRPLDRAAAESLDNYHLERWAYHWTAGYGSKDYKISNPKQPGHDPVRLRAARLLRDGRTVFLEIEDFRPAMQMSIDYQLQAAADGAAINQSFFCTINGLGKERIETGAPAGGARPGELSAATRKNLRPGLRVEFRPFDASAAIEADARVARLAAWYVPGGGSATPFLPPGRFRAAARGYLHVDLGGEYRLSLRGRGAATVRVNGQEILRGALQASGGRKPPGSLETLQAAAVKLHQGYNRLEIDYRSPPEGDARLRLYWSSDSFPPEPIPPAALSHDRRDPLLNAQTRLRRGRELFATRHCARCHGLPSGVSSAAAMPELSAAPPDLNGVGGRLESAWIAAWLLDPAKLRNHATMPSMLADLDAPRQAAADLAAFLGEGEREGESGRGGEGAIGDVESGEILYENLGCISCHTLTAPGEKDEFGRTSLHYVASKFRPGALAAFLAAPREHYPGSRMPDSHLNADEAADLAAFLRKYAEGEIAPLAELQSADAARGAKLFTTTGCNQCHALGVVREGEAPAELLGPRRGSAGASPSQPRALLWTASIDGGCLADEPRGKVPDFRLTADQRAALAAFLKTGGQSLGRTNAAEASLRLMERLRCVACHDRDEKFSRWPEILAVEGVQGLPPELMPNLTWAGEKLRGDWTARLLAGKLDYRSRPWLHARMPAFPHYAKILAAGLAAQHGLGPNDLDRPPLDPRLAEIGEKLTLKNGGLDCRQCHNLKTITVKQENNAQGISFLHVPQRIRYEYYHRWMLDPLRIDPGTKMPRFSPDHRHTPATTILDGDARRQYEALWHYLQAVGGRGKVGRICEARPPL